MSLAPLVGRSQIPEVMAGKTLPTYRWADATSSTDIDLPSGASTTINVRTTPSNLGLSDTRPGVYLIGAVVTGTTPSGDTISRRVITLLPWMPKSQITNELGVTTIWTLTAAPSRELDGTFMNAGLATSVTAGGRLRSQLDAMAQVPNALWLLDPLLIESVNALASGARIRTDNGDVRATTDAEMQAASAWIADLLQAITTGTVAAMPLGDFDVQAALKFGHKALVESTLSQSPARLESALSLSTVPLVVPLYGGGVTDSTWKLLSKLNVNTALVTDAGYQPTQTSYTPSSFYAESAFDGKVLVIDQDVSASLIAHDIAPDQLRQQFAAQLLMTFLERPNDDRVITVAVPPNWNPGVASRVAKVLNASWIQHETPASTKTAGNADRRVELISASHTQRMQDLKLDTAIVSQRLLHRLTADAPFRASLQDAVTGVLSHWWTWHLSSDSYSAPMNRHLSELVTSVRVVTRGEIVFGTESGQAPVTIANGLPVPVDIRLHAVGVPSVRVQPTENTDIHINAGKRISVQVPVRVSGSGDAYLSLQLRTQDDYGITEPVLLTVRSAAYARVAGYLVAGAFALLLLLVAFNTVRRVRSHHADEDDE